MFLSVVLLARTHGDAFIVRSMSSRVRQLPGDVENMQALFGVEEEKHS